MNVKLDIWDIELGIDPVNEFLFKTNRAIDLNCPINDGIVHLILFNSIWKATKFVKLCQDDGIDPMNEFCRNLSATSFKQLVREGNDPVNEFLSIWSWFNTVNVDIEFGIDPPRLLENNFKANSFVNEDIELGIVPTNLLVFNLRVTSCELKPSDDGILPVNILLPRPNVLIFGNWNIDEGIVPVKLLKDISIYNKPDDIAKLAGIDLDNLFDDKSKYIILLRLINDVVIDPVIWLYDISTELSFCKFIKEGRLPVKLFNDMFIETIFDSWNIDGGSVPLNLLSDRSMVFRFVSPDNVDGIVPYNLLLLKYKLISDVSVPKDVGSVPVILLFVKFIETMLLDEHNIPAHEDDWQGSPLGQNHEFLYLLVSFMFEE